MENDLQGKRNLVSYDTVCKVWDTACVNCENASSILTIRIIVWLGRGAVTWFVGGDYHALAVSIHSRSTAEATALMLNAESMFSLINVLHG